MSTDCNGDGGGDDDEGNDHRIVNLPPGMESGGSSGSHDSSYRIGSSRALGNCACKS